MIVVCWSGRAAGNRRGVEMSFEVVRHGIVSAHVWWTGGVDVASLLLELYGRVPPLARRAVEGLDPDQLVAQAAAGTNSIGWLVWHLARVHDHHVAELLDTSQIWVGDGWAERFGLAPDPNNIGYGHSPDDVAAVRPDGAESLMAYLEVVDARTTTMLGSLQPDDLDRIVDRPWDPPVTMGVRLVSIADDCRQHVGQANHLRGVLGIPQGAQP